MTCQSASYIEKYIQDEDTRNYGCNNIGQSCSSGNDCCSGNCTGTDGKTCQTGLSPLQFLLSVGLSQDEQMEDEEDQLTCKQIFDECARDEENEDECCEYLTCQR